MEYTDSTKTITKIYKIYGADGHRQRISFQNSFVWDFSNETETRIIEVDCQDKTKTNDYVIVKITRNTEQDCIDELEGQLSDGLFENSRYGKRSKLWNTQMTHRYLKN